jgi:radical SAM protein with 4Fe4S-binding SPASM domain
MCLAGRNYCFIDALGNAYPCLNFKSGCDEQERKGLRAEPKLGNIRSSAFADIWRSSRLLAQIRSASSKSFSVCCSCQSVGCKPCMALNYEEHGELFSPARAVCAITTAAMRVSNATFVPASELVVQ